MLEAGKDDLICTWIAEINHPSLVLNLFTVCMSLILPPKIDTYCRLHRPSPSSCRVKKRPPSSLLIFADFWELTFMIPWKIIFDSKPGVTLLHSPEILQEPYCRKPRSFLDHLPVTRYEYPEKFLLTPVATHRGNSRNKREPALLVPPKHAVGYLNTLRGPSEMYYGDPIILYGDPLKYVQGTSGNTL